MNKEVQHDQFPALKTRRVEWEKFTDDDLTKMISKKVHLLVSTKNGGYLQDRPHKNFSWKKLWLLCKNYLRIGKNL